MSKHTNKLEAIKKVFFTRFVESDPNIDAWDEGQMVMTQNDVQELWEWFQEKLEEERKKTKEVIGLLDGFLSRADRLGIDSRETEIIRKQLNWYKYLTSEEKQDE